MGKSAKFELAQSGLDISKKFPLGSLKQNLRDKDMLTGSKIPNMYARYLLNNDEIVVEDVTYAPALLKAVDEVVVNTLDHARNMLKSCKYDDELQVTLIKLNLDMESGTIIIYNNGQGVPVEVHNKANKYLPQIFFDEGYQGSNVKKPEDSTTGGTNGVGAKLTNEFSSSFKLDTVYKRYVLKNNKNVFDSYVRYRQNWKGGLSNYSTPKLTKVECKPYTKITFKLLYDEIFGTSFANIKDVLDKLVHMRLIMASIFVNWATNNKCKVMYNDKDIDVTKFSQLSKYLSPNIVDVHEVTLYHKKQKGFVWNLVFAIGNHEKETGVHLPQLTNINGVMSVSGRHTEHLTNLIHAKVKNIMVKDYHQQNLRLQKALIHRYLFIFGNFLIGGEFFTGQTKEHADVTKDHINNIIFGDKLDEVAYKVAKFVNQDLNANKKDKPIKETKIINGKGIEDAKYAGIMKKKYIHKRYLLLCEGDSALQFCTNGYSYKNPKTGEFNYDPNYIGLLKLGGVIANIKKWYMETLFGKKYVKADESANTANNSDYEDCMDDYEEDNKSEDDKDFSFTTDHINDYFSSERKIVLKDKLMNNVFFKTFLLMTGLNINYKYLEGDPDYERQLAELRYDAIVCCVDQDHDGKGLIFSLILNIFVTFWPTLFARDFVKRFETPIIRLKPKTKKYEMIEFQHIFQFDEWAKSNGHLLKHYDLKYVKGLAGNSKLHARELFKGFEHKLFVYVYDKHAQKVFNKFFGADSEPRKEFLRKPYKSMPIELINKQISTLKVSVSKHANYELGMHQKLRLPRAIPSFIDGFTSVGRKIFYTAMLQWSNSSTNSIKINNFQAHVQIRTAYQHGDGPLINAIFKMIMVCSGGGKQLPLLLPDGTGASRSGGKHPAARYVSTILNKDLTRLLFPSDDMQLLDYKVEEGQEIEPKYFVPIIPMAILESISAPACGWMIKCWARCAFDVINIVKQLIYLDSEECAINTSHILEPKLCECGYTGYSRYYKGKPTSFGLYEYDEESRVLTINELPLRVWFKNYVSKITKEKMYVEVDANNNRMSKADIAKNPKSVIKRQIFDNTHSNSCNDDYICIEIIFCKPKNGFDPVEYIKNNYGNDQIDCFTDYFQLYKILSDNINLLNENEDVKEFKAYSEVIFSWYKVRRDMYSKRIDRQLIIKELEIVRKRNVVKYIEMLPKLYPLIKKCANIEAANNLLKNEGFIGFNEADYSKIGSFKTEDIRTNVLDVKPTYAYLLDKITMSKVVKSRLDDLRAKLAKLEADFEEYKRLMKLGSFKGANIWISELDELEAVIRRGKADSWGIGN